MAYNNTIDRTGAEALIPEEYSREIIQELPAQSTLLQLARRLPNMSRKQYRMPVLNSLLTAYFVNGDSGLKQTAKEEWSNVFLTAEEVAVIVPIPEAVLDDADYDIWAEVKPRIGEAFGALVDAAMLFGTSKPASWPTDILTAASNASNVVDLSSAISGGGDLYDAILGEAGVVGLVEADGYMPTGHIGAMTLRGKLRGLRDDSGNGQPIFMRSLGNGQNMQERARYELDGEPILFPKNGAMNPTTALLVTGDWTRLLYSIRQDITYKVLTEAVITDDAGAVVYNLAQQDMVALRAVLRLGFATPNPPNRIQPTAGSRYPFAVLVP